MLLSACSEPECTTDGKKPCADGRVCVDEHCRTACYSYTDCQPAELCVHGVCTPGTPCGVNDTCPTSTVCRKPENVCTPFLPPSCESGGLCPSLLLSGTSCVDDGALTPCSDYMTSCDEGCRVCSAAQGWSECRYDICTHLGVLTSCGVCGDNCMQSVVNARANCVAVEDTFVCTYLGSCVAGYVDVDAVASNGCECAQSIEVCDGLDNDCNQQIDDGPPIDCHQFRADADGDNYGAGAAICACSPPEGLVTTVGDDCDDDVSTCNTDCTTDMDADGQRDCDDPCVDVDGDGLGNGWLDNIGCVRSETDSNDESAVACADTDQDQCDDCSGGSFDPLKDGTDVDADGICSTADCDETLPTCTFDCVTNTDAAGESRYTVTADCVERFCGTDPADAASACWFVRTGDAIVDGATLTTLIGELNAAAGHEHVLIGSVQTQTSFPAIVGTDGMTIRQCVGARVSAVTHGQVTSMFTLAGNNSVLDGITISDGSPSLYMALQRGVTITGNNNSLMRSDIAQFVVAGVVVDGGTAVISGNHVVGNRIHGNRVPNNAELTAGIYLKSVNNTYLAANLLALAGIDGVQLNATTNTFIDHNTLASTSAASAAEAVQFLGTASTNLCARNNNFSGAWTTAMDFQSATTTWNNGAACTDALDPQATGQPMYGNNRAPATPPCVGAGPCCSGGCFPPTGEFFSISVDPVYPSIIATDAAYYCPGATALTDTGRDLGYKLLSIFRRGATEVPSIPPVLGAGTYNSTAPDIGARESGVGGCP